MHSLKCSDAGFDCKQVIKGNSKEEIMSQAMEHGKHEHDLKDSDFTPELVNKIEGLIIESKD
ncbi:MAG: DUF1059 domain-containing protein [Candidatus Nitrosocosmicus sp.]|nr:DUF1059 domain-containing protein [Candidatus Nitrosocosmicus sp.]